MRAKRAWGWAAPVLAIPSLRERRDDIPLLVRTHLGIPADLLPHIFDRYWQAGSTDRRGIGLGLSIAAGIVAVHAGRVWVESQVGRRSSFHVTLPRAGWR